MGELGEWGSETKPAGADWVGNIHDRCVASGGQFSGFHYRPEGWKADMPLTNASSMVSELAPVALYLRHIVLPGNVLIVEEPESHLHPAMQVGFARQLAAVVNSGVRVVITTHSEWLLGALANLVKSSELYKGRKSKTGEDDAALRPDQVGGVALSAETAAQGVGREGSSP